MLTKDEVFEAVSKLTHRALEAALRDWEIQIGFEATLGEPTVDLINGPAALDLPWAGKPHLCVTTQVEHAASGTVQFFFPTKSAWPLVREALCLPSSIEIPKVFDDVQVDTFKEMMNLMCGSANAVYDEFGMRMSQSVEHLNVEQGKGNLPEGMRGVAITMPYSSDGDDPAPIVQLMSYPLARAVALSAIGRAA